MALEQSVPCFNCSFENPANFRYCGGCGASLERSAARAATELIAQERPHPERRQLTIMFCDMVESTALSTRLDPEELRVVMHEFLAACSAVVRRYGGTVSRYMGDGILALFGYPRAHEDDAERAVRSGLDIIAAVAELPAPGGTAGSERLAVRIGIATGLVVAGDLIGEGASKEEAVVGETPNLAARNQALAAANTVVIAASTQAIISERFDCLDLGAHVMKGFSTPMRAWRVLAPRAAGSRFESAKRIGVSALVDREEPLRWLRQLWQEAERDGGRVALLAGESGVGKSRLVEALWEEVERASHTALCYQCSPYYSNTALYPLIEHIQRAAGIGREDTSASKLAKLSSWLGAQHETHEATALLGLLLSIPAQAPSTLPAMSPQRQKELTFDLLLRLMQRKARDGALLVVFEDVHWLDPTTQEFLSVLIERVRTMRAVVVLTFRPEFSPPWNEHPHIERHEVKNLTVEYALELTRQVAAERLPPSVIEQVVAKTDGVPLFVEELTRAVLGSELLSTYEDRLTPNAALLSHFIPSTLQDSLMERLDQLGPAKHVAQIAAAIGREFTAELLEAIAFMPAHSVREGLRDLEQAGLIFAEPGASTSSYVFKHALVQDVAYQSLLRSRRYELHLRIAELLERNFPQTARDAPELVAHHWTEARVAERSTAAWLAAGLRASERSEHREAIAHLRKGLTLVPRLADERMRRERELELLLALGPVLITTEGGGAPEVGALYARCVELCEGIPESAAHVAAYWGSWRAAMDLRTGRERADKMLALSNRIGDSALRLQGHHCQWATLYMLGAHEECCRHIEQGLALYEPDNHRVHAALYGGHDVRVCALGERGLARWMLGSSRDALSDVHASLDWAKELNHVGSRAHAMDYALVLHKFRRDARAVAAWAEELVAFASEQHLRDHQAKGAFFLGWARAMLHDLPAGLQEMRASLAAFEGVGTPEDLSVDYEMLAQACLRGRQFDAGLRVLDDAFAQTERHGILFWNAELHRRRGDLLLAAGAPRDAVATCFNLALECAREQGALVLELRAATRLARLHATQSAPQALALLRQVYDRIADRDTPDATDARAVLETLE